MGIVRGFAGLVAGEAHETPSAVPLGRRAAGGAGIALLKRKAVRFGLKPSLPQSFFLFDCDKYLCQAAEPCVGCFAHLGREVGTMAVEDSVARPSLGFWNHSGQSESR